MISISMVSFHINATENTERNVMTKIKDMLSICVDFPLCGRTPSK